MSATQLSHLQEFAITSLAGSGTIFASHSPRAAPPNPAFAVPSPTAYCPDGLTSHPVSVSASGTSDASFATPLASPLPSPLMSPLRGVHGGAEGGLSPGVGGQRQGSIVKASSPPSKSHGDCNRLCAIHIAMPARRELDDSRLYLAPLRSVSLFLHWMQHSRDVHTTVFTPYQLAARG